MGDARRGRSRRGRTRAEPASTLSLSRTLGGRWRLDAELGPLDGEVLDTALRLAQGFDADEADTARSRAQRRAEALGEICRGYLQRRDQPAGSRHRPHVNVIVHLDDLLARRGGECPDATVIDGASLGALSCDSVLHRVLVAGRSTVLDYGTSTRTISANLFAALVVRDRHCRFPGCDRPASWCDAHHVVHVADGGATCPSNLVLVCSRHHHRLHQPGWSATLGDDAELMVSDPEGRHRTSHPPGHSPRPPPELFAA